MKKLLFSGFFTAMLFLCFSVYGQAQDFCKQVKKEITDKTTFSYTAPFDSTRICPIKIARLYSTNPEIEFDNFSITLFVTGDLQEFFKKNPDGDGANDSRKLLIQFDDNTTYKEDSVTISYEHLNDIQLIVKSVFVSIGTKNVANFTDKKIAKFGFGGLERTISADSAMAYKSYLQCIKNVKQVTDAPQD